jgi:hypothetical protein
LCSTGTPALVNVASSSGAVLPVTTSKGKAGVPVELGLRVAVAEDRHGFILRHRVMQKTTDDQIALPLIEETKARFGAIAAVSFDKGFHSPENQAELLKAA